MSTIILGVLFVGVGVLYMLRRKARIRSEETF